MTSINSKAPCQFIEHASPDQTAACLQLVAAANALEFSADFIENLRARNTARSKSFAAETPFHGVDVEETTWDAASGRRAVRIYRPNEQRADAIAVYFHGGGFVTGSLDAVDLQCRRISKSAGVTVASFAYALAPEHPFPAAVEDAFAAVAWARERLHAPGKPAAPVIAMGDSAGGNLAAVVSQSLSRYPLHNVIGQVLIYPVMDLSGESWSYADHGVTPTLTAERMRWYAGQYLGNVSRTDPRISPLLTSNLENVAPALIISAEVDPLLGEAEAYAASLRNNGINTEHYVFRGLYHGFWNWGAKHNASDHACRIAVEWLKKTIS